MPLYGDQQEKVSMVTVHGLTQTTHGSGRVEPSRNPNPDATRTPYLNRTKGRRAGPITMYVVSGLPDMHLSTQEASESPRD